MLHKQTGRKKGKDNNIEPVCDIKAVLSNSPNVSSNTSKKIVLLYPMGKPMLLHLLRCQGIAVADYSFTLGRLETAASSTFATSGFTLKR
jgi:hypothetical protein